MRGHLRGHHSSHGVSASGDITPSDSAPERDRPEPRIRREPSLTAGRGSLWCRSALADRSNLCVGIAISLRRVAETRVYIDTPPTQLTDERGWHTLHFLVSVLRRLLESARMLVVSHIPLRHPANPADVAVCTQPGACVSYEHILMTKGRFNGSGTFRFWPLRSIFQIRQLLSLFFVCTHEKVYPWFSGGLDIFSVLPCSSGATCSGKYCSRIAGLGVDTATPTRSTSSGLAATMEAHGVVILQRMASTTSGKSRTPR